MDSRKIDALVAEYVTELTIYTKCLKNHKPWCGAEKCSLECKELQGWSLPHYSTEWGPAGVVVEKLTEAKRWNWGISIYARDHSKVFVSITDETFTKITDAIAETAPLAICLAALKAKGVPVDN